MIDIPDTDAFRAMTAGYPVDGDKIAAHLDDPHPSHPFRRFPFGDLLWKQPGVNA